MSILSVTNLQKKFGDLTVLKDISFQINDGVRRVRATQRQRRRKNEIPVVAIVGYTMQYRNLLTRAMLPTAKKLPVWLSTPA